jgi:hypothetical protein
VRTRRQKLRGVGAGRAGGSGAGACDRRGDGGSGGADAARLRGQRRVGDLPELRGRGAGAPTRTRLRTRAHEHTRAGWAAPGHTRARRADVDRRNTRRTGPEDTWAQLPARSTWGRCPPAQAGLPVQEAAAASDPRPGPHPGPHPAPHPTPHPAPQPNLTLPLTLPLTPRLIPRLTPPLTPPHHARPAQDILIGLLRLRQCRCVAAARATPLRGAVVVYGAVGGEGGRRGARGGVARGPGRVWQARGRAARTGAGTCGALDARDGRPACLPWAGVSPLSPGPACLACLRPASVSCP